MLLRFYLAVEGAWYSLLDFLHKRMRLPVYSYFAHPLERLGVPSFLVFLVIMVLVLFLVWIALTK